MEIEDILRKDAGTDLFSCLTDIPVVDSTLPYNAFFKNFILKNIPCKIRDICSSWECSRYWVEDNRPAFTYLQSKYGHSKSIVYDCNKKFFNSQKCENMLFSDFLKYWQDCVRQKPGEQAALLYLKDWHLKNLFPKDNFYEVPLYFASDWLNEYLCENNKDDYKFVYMGPKGTW